MAKKNKKQEANHALCPSDYSNCPKDCDHCYDILSLNQGDCRACWEHYFDRTVKGWSERELKEQTVFVNSGDLMDILEQTVTKINDQLKKNPDNIELKDTKMFILEALYENKILGKNAITKWLEKFENEKKE